MNAKPITVVAEMQAKPGHEAHVQRELLSLVAPTRNEAGCLNYDLHRSADNSARFLFHENWASKADLDRHLKALLLQAVLAKVGELLARPPRITIWEKVV
jgi:quinol monooxygenase YgiN